MTVKCTFCNDTKREPGIPGPCVWCEQVGAAPVAVGYQLAKGFTDPVGDCEKFEAGITVNAWLQRIVVYGDSPADAEALRDHIMSSAEREAALREELTTAKRAVPHTAGGGISQRDFDYDRGFSAGSAEVETFRLERDALQQRLTVAERALARIQGRAEMFIDDGMHMPTPSIEAIRDIAAKAALKPAAKPHKCIECDSQYCHGVCVERGDDDERYKGAEGEGS